MLGERYHQIWAPLRVVLGFGMLMPIAGGFSTVHYLLRDVVGVAAVQIGNAPIKAYIAGMAHNPPGISPAAMQGATVANQVLSLQACAAVVDGINRHVNPWVMVARATPYPKPQTTSGGYVWNFGDCGSMTLRTPSIKGDFGEGAADRIAAFALARGNATQQLMADIAPIIDSKGFGDYFATKTYNPETVGAVAAREMMLASIIQPDLASRMRVAADKWNVAVSDAAKAAFAGADETMKANLGGRIQEYGFMVAGSYERTLSQISALAVSVAADKPAAVLGSPGYRYNNAYKGSQAVIIAARQEAARTRGLSDGGNADPGDGSDAMDFVGSVVAPMLDVQPVAKSADPVGDMISRGQWLLTGGQAGIAAMTVANSLSEGAKASVLGWIGGGAIAGAITYLASWAGYAIMLAMLVGIMHAYVLPMIPMIMVFVMGVSWLVLFLEAAIAGVLWAFVFIRMDGQDFFDKNQTPGITLLFNLFARPAIGMLAFIGGMILMPHLLNGLAVIWDDAFAAQTQGPIWNWAIGKLVGLVMFCWMQWHLYMRVYGLIPTIADRVGHWMGFQMHGYNEGAATEAASGAMIAAGGAVAKAPLLPKGKANGGGSGRGLSDAARKAADQTTAQPPQGRK